MTTPTVTKWTSKGETLDLVECPDCGFSFDAIHRTDTDPADPYGPDWNCPCCEEARLGTLVTALEATQAQLVAAVELAVKHGITCDKNSPFWQQCNAALALVANAPEVTE